MPINTFDFSRLPVQSGYVKDDNSALENLLPNLLGAYRGGQQNKIDREAAARKKEAEELSNHFLKNYGGRRQEAEISALERGMFSPFGQLIQERAGLTNPEDISAYDKMINSTSMGGGRSGLTPGMRAFSSLPAAAREDLLANIRPLTPHMTDIERINLLNSGGTLEGIREQARENGIDVDNAMPINAPTTANITQSKNQEASGAELDYLENITSGPLSKHSRKFFGYSPTQVIEAISGENKDEQAQYLAARAIQPEIASSRSRITAGSTASEALHRAQADALGSSKIFEGLVDPEVFGLTQHYINKWLKEGLQVRQRALHSRAQKQQTSSEYNPFEAADISIEDLMQMREKAQ